MIYEKIDLISEMLDATLNLKCFCIKGLNDDLSFINFRKLYCYMFKQDRTKLFIRRSVFI